MHENTLSRVIPMLDPRSFLIWYAECNLEKRSWVEHRDDRVGMCEGMLRKDPGSSLKVFGRSARDCHAERSEVSRKILERPCEILRFAQHDRRKSIFVG